MAKFRIGDVVEGGHGFGAARGVVLAVIPEALGEHDQIEVVWEAGGRTTASAEWLRLVTG